MKLNAAQIKKLANMVHVDLEIEEGWSGVLVTSERKSYILNEDGTLRPV